MRATVMYGAGDVRVEQVPDPTIEFLTDAVVRVVRACVCGSDLHPYHSMPASEQGAPMGHEFVGVVEEVGSAVARVGRGRLEPGRVFDRTVGLDATPEGYAAMDEREALKVLVRP